MKESFNRTMMIRKGGLLLFIYLMVSLSMASLNEPEQEDVSIYHIRIVEAKSHDSWVYFECFILASIDNKDSIFDCANLESLIASNVKLNNIMIGGDMCLRMLKGSADSLRTDQQLINDDWLQNNCKVERSLMYNDPGLNLQYNLVEYSTNTKITVYECNRYLGLCSELNIEKYRKNNIGLVNSLLELDFNNTCIYLYDNKY